MFGYGNLTHYFARNSLDAGCEACGGTGREAIEHFNLPCSICNGTGKAPAYQVPPLVLKMYLLVLIGLAVSVMFLLYHMSGN